MKKWMAVAMATVSMFTLTCNAFAVSRASAYAGTSWRYFLSNSTTTANKTISQDFGGTHMGIDIPVGEGTTAYCVADGIVELAFVKFNDSGKPYPSDTVGYGLALKTNTSDPGTKNKLIVTYQHFQSRPIKNNKTNIATGDSLSKGDTIGKTGNTGNSTGPHLHFDVSKDGTWWEANSVSKHVDPKLFYPNVEWKYSKSSRTISDCQTLNPDYVMDVAFIDYVGQAAFEEWVSMTSVTRSVQTVQSFKQYFNITPEIEKQILNR